jgi:hypothetical protein
MAPSLIHSRGGGSTGGGGGGGGVFLIPKLQTWLGAWTMNSGRWFIFIKP